MKTYKVILTGGHAATTALSVAEEFIKRNNKDGHLWDIYWVGAQKAIEGKNFPTIESTFFPKMGVKYYSIFTGRLQRKFTLWTIPSLAKIPIGFVHAFAILRKIKPDLILSFGGYAAFPVVVIGYLLKVPIILHDQTVIGNLTNRMSSPFATKIALARRECSRIFPKDKTVIIGNPIMSEIINILPKKSLAKVPTIYITGGSRGSESINNLIEKILPELLRNYIVIHQTGYKDYAKFQKIRSDMPKEIIKAYKIYSILSYEELANIYNKADIVVARGGANTVAEIIVTKRPALIIPLAVGSHQEQKENAVFAENYGVAKVLDQEKLTSEKLREEINLLKDNWYSIVDKIRNKKSPDLLAASKLVDLIEEVIA